MGTTEWGGGAGGAQAVRGLTGLRSPKASCGLQFLGGVWVLFWKSLAASEGQSVSQEVTGSGVNFLQLKLTMVMALQRVVSWGPRGQGSYVSPPSE